MATTLFRNHPTATVGELPAVGASAPDFTLVGQDLAEKTLASFPGKRILNIFPSIDTPVCALSVRTFNARAAAIPGVSVLNISADLPFAAKRFCGAEGLEGVHTLSSFRSTFGRDYGTTFAEGPFVGLMARCVVAIDADGTVLFSQITASIGDEPDYDGAIAAVSA